MTYNERKHTKESEDKFTMDFENACGSWIRGYEGNAQRAWGALANVVWEHRSGAQASCSFRVADGWISDITGGGSYYCGSGDGLVPVFIAEAMHAKGWRPTEY